MFFTLDRNATLGSHTGDLEGSLQPSIHEHLSAAANIAANGFQGWLIHVHQQEQPQTTNTNEHHPAQESMIHASSNAALSYFIIQK